LAVFFGRREKVNCTQKSSPARARQVGAAIKSRTRMTVTKRLGDGMAGLLSVTLGSV
jgi:hypothetical protein